MAIKAKAEITISRIIDIEKVNRYYLLQSSTLVAPIKPTDGAAIGSNWSKAEPSYVSGSTSTLYFVDQTVFSNGVLKYSEVSKSSSYEAAKEAWNKASNAQNTANSAVADTYQEYYLSTSQTALSGGFWSATSPTWVNGKYMWSRTVKVDGAGNKTYSPSQNGVCIAGAKGDTGAAGKGIKSTTITYQLCASQTQAPTGTWLASPPKTDTATPYLWTRTVTTYTDNTTSIAYSVSSTFDSLKVGGRNLKLNSNFQKGTNGWVAEGAGFVSESDSLYKYCGKAIFTSSYASQQIYTSDHANKYNLQNKQYAVSFMAKASDTIKLGVYRAGTAQTISTVTLSKDWQRFSMVYTASGTGSITFKLLAAGTLYITNLKVEEGNIATDWTPAPEDIETRVTAAETNITNNATEISLKASQTEVANIAANLDAYIDKSTSMIQNINGWQFNWDTLIRTAEADVANHTDYITLKNGDIILGESSSELKVKIANDSIQFKGTGTDEVEPDPDATAWITGQKFNINEGEIHNSLRIGKLQIMPRANGNFAICIVEEGS